MIYFSFRFLLCNAIICIFLGGLLGLKNLLQRQLSACMQYNLSIIFLAVLIVPFLPISSAPSSISWSHLLTASSSTNGDIQTTFLSGNGYNLDKINDFAVSVSTQIPTFIHTLLVFFWSIGIFIMFFLLYRSVKQVKALHSSALPLQNEELNALYIECLNEVNSKHTIPIYSTAFLKSPVLAGFLHPRIYLPIHLISDFNAGTISATDIRYMFLHELQHYRNTNRLSLAFAGERSWRICFNGSLSVKRIELLYSVVKEHERRKSSFLYTALEKRGNVTKIQNFFRY